MTLSITKTTPIEGRAVEVHGTTQRGARQEWVVFLKRDNTVDHAFCYMPASGYTAEHLIPFEVKEAALRHV